MKGVCYASGVNSLSSCELYGSDNSVVTEWYQDSLCVLNPVSSQDSCSQVFNNQIKIKIKSNQIKSNQIKKKNHPQKNERKNRKHHHITPHHTTPHTFSFKFSHTTNISHSPLFLILSLSLPLIPFFFPPTLSFNFLFPPLLLFLF